MAEHTPENTPRKYFRFIKFTPKSKKILCLLCGNKTEDSNYRGKLFNGSTKTEFCILIEKYLEVTVTEDTHTDTACRKCIRRLQKIDNDINAIKQSYQGAISKLKETHGCDSISFKRQFIDDDNGDRTAKKSLFPKKLSTALPAETDDILAISHIKVSPKRTDKIYLVEEDHSAIVEALASNDIEQIGKLILNLPELQELVKSKVCTTIQDEIRILSLKSSNSILRNANFERLETFSFQSIFDEWKEKAPTFSTFLMSCISNPSHKRNQHKKDDALLPGMIAAGSKLLSLYNQELNLLQHMNSVLLWKGGCKNSAFSRLNATNDCLSYRATLDMTDRLASRWDEDLMKWQEDVALGRTHERHIMNEISLVKESIDLLEMDPESNVDLIFQLADLEQDLAKLRASMHPGYYFVGDNVDTTTTVRNMTLTNQNKSNHMYQICAYLNRVSGNHLQDEEPKADVKTTPFHTLMPNKTDRDKLADEFAFLVARVWTTNILCFKPFQAVLPACIEHQYLKEMKQKSQRINVGVLMKCEQYNDEMTDICEFMHKFVPGHDESDDWNKTPEKILSGGDYLTFERHKEAQSSKRNSRTPSKRLEGLIPKMEEFHNQSEILKVIWQLLYSTSSSRDTGTMFSARNVINARNVTKDPSDNYYASSEFMEKNTTAYIVTGALKYFQMESTESQPTTNAYTGELCNPKEMKDYILRHAKSFVNDYCLLEIPSLPDYGPQSLHLECRYCNKQYKQGAALRRHEAKIHGHHDPMYTKTNSKPEESTSDGVLNYTKLFLNLGLLRLNHNDAIHMGDGERMMRINNFLFLYYKYCNCTKYAYGILETIAQSKILLTDRLAHQLIWNRTVNHKGNQDSNHPNDLDIEHCNKVFKDQAHSYRGVYTEKTVSRVSRTALKVHDISKQFDKVSKVFTSSGHHTAANIEDDISTLVGQFQKKKVFDFVPGRFHSAFPNIKANPLADLDMCYIRDWIGTSLEKFQRKHFYPK